MRTGEPESSSEVPEVTLAFWIIKIAATTLWRRNKVPAAALAGRGAVSAPAQARNQESIGT
jgi:hypothetical protein